jgi:diguanylate cyclase (GGDEF)-like protein
MRDEQIDLIENVRRLLEADDLPSAERGFLTDLLGLIRQQIAELDALKRISLNLTTSLTLKEVLETLVTEAMKLVKNAHDVHIFLYEDDRLRFGAALDSQGRRNLMYAAPRPGGLTYTVARTGQTIIVEDMRNHPLYTNTSPDWIGSIIGMPLKISERVVGVMNLARQIIGGFTDSEMRLLQLLADQAAIAINNAGLHEAVSKQAFTDLLTGLPNRRALDERLDEEVRRANRFHHPFAVVMMDVDGFKVINDTFGHTVGDKVLRQAFTILAQNLRGTDFLARYGGDELTLIMPESDFTAAQTVAEKLQQRLHEFKIDMPDGSSWILGISGGIAIFPVHARNAPDLIRAADEALYRAKRHHRGTFVPARGFTGELQAPKTSKS